MARIVRVSASGSSSSEIAQRSIGVSTLPGATALTRTPYSAKSSAIDRVRPISPCLPVV